MRYIILVLMILTVSACGKGGGGGNSSRSQDTSEVRFKCDAKTDHSDLMSIAVSANRLRSECGLEEKDAIKFMALRGER